MNYREVKCQDKDIEQTIKWILQWCCFHSFNVHVDNDGPYDLDIYMHQAILSGLNFIERFLISDKTTYMNLRLK